MGFEEKENDRKNSGVVSKIVKSDNETKNNSIENAVIVPLKDEPRSKRVNLLIQPSIHKKAQRKCKEMGISLNECMNQLLVSWLQE